MNAPDRPAPAPTDLRGRHGNPPTARIVQPPGGGIVFDNWVSEDCRWGMHGWACYETAIDCACPCHEEDAMSEEAWDRTAHRYWPLAILVAVGIVWWWHAKKPRA